MWGRQTEKASAMGSAVHTQSFGWRLYFIICFHCQKMQSENRTNVTSAISIFLTASVCLVVTILPIRQCLQTLLLCVHVFVCCLLSFLFIFLIWQMKRCLRPTWLPGHAAALWSCGSYHWQEESSLITERHLRHTYFHFQGEGVAEFAW